MNYRCDEFLEILKEAVLIIIEGKYNTAVVFAETVEETAFSQIKTLLDQEAFADSKIRIMPDVHSGQGCVIGLTASLGDKVVPNIVGVDIGCGMLTIPLGEMELNLAKLDAIINWNIPSGFDLHKVAKTEFSRELNDLAALKALTHQGWSVAKWNRQIGTLGGGNHFIEVDVDSAGNKYLVIHSGSRHLGKQIADYYQHLALETCRTDEDLRKLPRDLCFLSGDLMDMYLHDMKIAQAFAKNNRETMARIIFSKLRLNLEDYGSFHTIHNYIDFDTNIIRKGAIRAGKDEKILIPLNMRDGSLLCLGKGNEDWNLSAPHGAGRVMSRHKAKAILSMDEYEKSMSEIYTTSISRRTLDEAPMAYKPMDEIIKNIHDTAQVVERLKPIYNFKAAE